MPIRGKVPPFPVLFILAFAFVGLVGFQILRERRTASASISEKEYQLENVSQKLKEQIALAREREKERDTAQIRLLELERVSKAKDETLLQKDGVLQNMKSEHDRTVEDLSQLGKILKQKDEEIVRVRGELQVKCFQIAQESAKHQINNNVMETSLENRQAEEHKPADEAGLDDRKNLQEEEEASIIEGHLSATEKEMDERSKPKEHVLNEGAMTSLEEAGEKEVVSNTEDFTKPGDLLHEEEADEQDSADTRNVDEKEIDSSQEMDLHEDTKLDAELQTENSEEADAQDADHGAE